MEYLVTMTTLVPDGTAEEAVSEIRGREATRAAELATRGHLVRLWMLPPAPGSWHALGLWRAEDAGEMQAILEFLPMDKSMTIETTPSPSTRTTRVGPGFCTGAGSPSGMRWWVQKPSADPIGVRHASHHRGNREQRPDRDPL
jgi:muconolactone delta-isomerase